ncbi:MULTISPECIES: PaaI family thioesterase [Burkholderia]|nr:MULTISPECIES: PaaI family thioesterase [Burkholderia]
MNEPVSRPAPPDAVDDTPPDGFVRMATNGGFTAQLGTLYWHAERRAVGIRLGACHLNHLSIPHGGLLATLADTAIGIVLNRESGAKQQSVTAHLSLDYLNTARAGDWIEAQVDVDKMGARLHFATCRLMSGERCLLKANATFAVVRPR